MKWFAYERNRPFDLCENMGWFCMCLCVGVGVFGGGGGGGGACTDVMYETDCNDWKSIGPFSVMLTGFVFILAVHGPSSAVLVVLNVQSLWTYIEMIKLVYMASWCKLQRFCNSLQLVWFDFSISNLLTCVKSQFWLLVCLGFWCLLGLNTSNKWNAQHQELSAHLEPVVHARFIIGHVFHRWLWGVHLVLEVKHHGDFEFTVKGVNPWYNVLTEAVSSNQQWSHFLLLCTWLASRSIFAILQNFVFVDDLITVQD